MGSARITLAGLTVLLGLCGCSQTLPQQTPAQAAASFDAFATFGPSAKCQALAPSREDPAASSFVLSFEEGEETRDGRYVEVGYDSSGVPVWTTVRAYQLLSEETATNPRGSWRSIPHAYFIRFNRGAAGEGFHIPGLIMTMDSVIAAGRGRVMSADRVASARRMAEVLWRRGCGRTATE